MSLIQFDESAISLARAAGCAFHYGSVQRQQSQWMAIPEGLGGRTKTNGNTTHLPCCGWNAARHCDDWHGMQSQHSRVRGIVSFTARHVPRSYQNLEEQGKNDLACSLETGAWAFCRPQSENDNECRYFCHMSLLTSANSVISTSPSLQRQFIMTLPGAVGRGEGRGTNYEVKSKGQFTQKFQIRQLPATKSMYTFSNFHSYMSGTAGRFRTEIKGRFFFFKNSIFVRLNEPTLFFD